MKYVSMLLRVVFWSLSKLLLHISRLSLGEGILPDDLRAAKVTPIFKSDYENNLGN